MIVIGMDVHKNTHCCAALEATTSQLLEVHEVPARVPGPSCTARLGSRPRRRAGIAGIRGRPRFRRIAGVPTANDLVERHFAGHDPDQLWVTDITEHPTRRGKPYCAVVPELCSRRVVGWSIDASPTAALTTNALGMAIDRRRPTGSVTLMYLAGIYTTGNRFRVCAITGIGRRLR